MMSIIINIMMFQAFSLCFQDAIPWRSLGDPPNRKRHFSPGRLPLVQSHRPDIWSWAAHHWPPVSATSDWWLHWWLSFLDGCNGSEPLVTIDKHYINKHE